VIELTVRLTPRDVSRMRWNVTSRRWQPWLLGLTVVVLVSATVRDQWQVPALVALVVAAVLVSNRVVVRRAFRTNALLRGTQHWTIGDDGLRYETRLDSDERVAEGQIQWRALDRVIDARDEFLLFTSARGCMVLPKRCFAAEADIEQLRVLVEACGLLRA
jgi:hypothetical protein